MAANLTIRAATPADAESIADLHVASWRSAYRDALPGAYLDAPDLVQKRRQHWRERFTKADGDEIILVATLQQELIGFIGVFPTDERGYNMLIDNLHVHPDLRGRGIGRRLLGSAAERMLEAGVSSACLWVFDVNAAAIRFYQRLGGQADARQSNEAAPGQSGHMTRMGWRNIRALAAACAIDSHSR